MAVSPFEPMARLGRSARLDGLRLGERARTAPFAAALLFAAVLFGVPAFATDYFLSAIAIPVLVLGLAALGQNILTGYAGLLSVGSAAFMAVGAFGTYNFALRVPGLPLVLSLALGGLCAALVGLGFGLPSLRIRGFSLIVATLAAQFTVQWTLTKVSWFSNGQSAGVISAPPLTVFGRDFSAPAGRFQLTAAVVAVLAWAAHNLLRAGTGRDLLAVRDMETAAAVIGIPVLRTKLVAFALSSFYLGIAGALWAFTYLGTVEPHGFDLTRSFQVLSMVIIGGLGRFTGGFVGALFFVLLPIGLSVGAGLLLDGYLDGTLFENLQKVIFGSLIIGLLRYEPEGLVALTARLGGRIARRSARTAPAP